MRLERTANSLKGYCSTNWATESNELVRHQGLEPRTNWLRVNCSTNWANGACALYVTKKEHIMASIYSRIDKNGNKRFYGSNYHNGKRIRKSLGCSIQSAEALIKKLEYKLLFNIQDSNKKSPIPNYEKAILSFLKEVERTSVKVKQVTDIHTKLNYFKDYCFSISIHHFQQLILHQNSPC